MANEPTHQTPPPPLVGDPDTVLESYRRAVASLQAGLLDLEASPSYLMLTGDGLGPITAAKVNESAAAATDSWTRLAAVEVALDHVEEYVEAKGLRGTHRDEVERLLGQRWVEVGPGAPPQAIGEVLGDVRHDYDAIRPLVTEVEQLWLALLPRIDAAKATLGRLEAEADRLGTPEPLIGRAQALVADLEVRLVSDPLAVVITDGDNLDAQVAAAAAQMATLLGGHDNLDEDLARTEGLLASLRVLRARGEASGSEVEAKVAEVKAVRVPSAAILDGPGGLAERLDGVHDAAAGPWTKRRGLLDAWLSLAGKLERQLEEAIAANSEPLERRNELRGRLTAYQAKVSATGRAEDLELTGLVDRARVHLYTAPSDLDEAAASIEDVARKLRS